MTELELATLHRASISADKRWHEAITEKVKADTLARENMTGKNIAASLEASIALEHARREKFLLANQLAKSLTERNL